jgi:membrane protein DedA with SNARE-associated domain
MDSGLLSFVSDYGYVAVFLLVFLQEMGIPNPVPNELILLFAGALTSIGGLSVWMMFLVAVAADVIGTTLLFTVFYFFEHYIMERIKKWEKINQKLETIKAKLIKHDKFGIFLGRLMPYVRGYVSVAAGILNMPYRVFVPIVALSAAIWSGGYVVLGHFLGRQWEVVAGVIEQYKWSFFVVLASILIVWVYLRHRKNKNSKF